MEKNDKNCVSPSTQKVVNLLPPHCLFSLPYASAISPKTAILVEERLARLMSYQAEQDGQWPAIERQAREALKSGMSLVDISLCLDIEYGNLRYALHNADTV